MSKKISSKQMTEIHNHVKRHGVSFEAAKRAVLGGYGDAEAEREAMYAERRIQARIDDRAMFAGVMGAVSTLMVRNARGRRR
jgi:hypothetical protein